MYCFFEVPKDAFKKNLESIVYFPATICLIDWVNSSGAISVKKPTLPRFIPRTGKPLDPNFLAEPSRVPSPPIQTTRSAFFSI